MGFFGLCEQLFPGLWRLLEAGLRQQVFAGNDHGASQAIKDMVHVTIRLAHIQRGTAQPATVLFLQLLIDVGHVQQLAESA